MGRWFTRRGPNWREVHEQVGRLARPVSVLANGAQVKQFSRTRDPVVRAVLEWLEGCDSLALLPEFVPGATQHERQLLAGLGPLALAVSKAGSGGGEVPPEVSQWWSAPNQPPAALVGHLIDMMEDGREALGKVYTSIVSPVSRRKMGTFFTPDALTQFALAKCNEHEMTPRAVVDPGAGVGAFTLAAAEQWSTPVVAVDLNAVTLGLLAARCHYEGYETTASCDMGGEGWRDVQLVRTDFLTWVTTEFKSLPSSSLILGNPPYTRHQGLDPKTKRTARDAAGHLITSGLAGMAAYFLAASLRSIRPSDALCLLLPGSWMHTRYGRELREHLWRLDRPVDLAVFPNDLLVFPGTNVDAVMLFVGPRSQHDEPLIVSSPSLDGATVHRDDPVEIVRTSNVPPCFPRDKRAWVPPGRNDNSLGDSFRVRRGIATGCNGFFLLTDEEVRRYQIPPRCLQPAITRVQAIEGAVLDEPALEALGKADEKRWILCLSHRDARSARIGTYLARGLRDGVAEGFLASQREHWFVLDEDVAPAPLLVLPMTKRTFRVIVNTAGALHTNTLYGLYPSNDSVDVVRAAEWLRGSRGQQAMRNVARHYSSGLLKLEPRTLSTLPVPSDFALAGGS